MKPGVLTRVVAGMSVATPVTIVVTVAMIATSASPSVAGLIGAAAGAVCGLFAQRFVTIEVEGDDHE